MKKKAVGTLKAAWTVVISIALIGAGLMCLVLHDANILNVEDVSHLVE